MPSPLAHRADSGGRVDIPAKRISCWLGALAALLCAAAPGYTQSLSLTYSLAGAAESPPRAHAQASACSALRWLTSPDACGRDLLARFASVARSTAGDNVEPHAAPPAAVPSAAGASMRAASGASSPAFDLPALDGPVAALPRAARDAAGAGTRDPDLTLRLGPTARARGGEDASWDAYRFTDMKYEAHRQSKGHKTVGIELLVPFQ
jgi:hypothetical protein